MDADSKRVEDERFRVTAQALNVRSAPSRSSEVVGVLRRDDVIAMIEESEDRNWIRARHQGSDGWVSRKYLARIPDRRADDSNLRWMDIAEREKGVNELPGIANNLRVLEYLRSTKDLSELAISRDETAWCSAFVNWCLKAAGYEGTQSALARSWLDWGREIAEPIRGCIAVFSRGAGYGHVGFYLSETENEIIVLGGNQQNAETKKYEVSEKHYPKSRLLGYRLPE